MISERNSLIQYFDALAPDRERWIARNRYYHDQLGRIFSFFIPAGRRVLEVGVGTGQLLAALKPSHGVGIDLSPNMVAVARQKHPEFDFRVGDVEQLDLDEKFDDIVISDLIGFLHDAQGALENLQRVSTPRTRLIISHYNFLWEPILRLGERIGLKARQPNQNWLGTADVENLLDLPGYEVVRTAYRLMLPKYIPLLSSFCNRVLVNLPLFRHLSLVFIVVARPKPVPRADKPSCTIVIPALNERGNIEATVQRTQDIGSHTEIIFVEGNSRDGTADEIKRVIAANLNRDIKLIAQGNGSGKGDAVRKGFAAAKGDVLMILDADLTVAPEELPRFYNALVSGNGEFIHGSRLVYPMQDQAMRFLNVLGNKFFSLLFTYLLDQRFKDTLCGTKVLYRSDYDLIAANRSYFGDFDPFGDFDLIFGAAKLNLKIMEVPIHYLARTYGSTNISRFKHGWLLFRMSVFAMRKMKFI